MNTLVVTPQVKSFKNGEFSKYIRTLLQLSEEEDLDTLELSDFVKELNTAYNNFKKVYKKNRGSILTPEMARYDNQRDNSLKLLQRGTKLIADFAGDEKDRHQANLIYATISKHGKEIYNMAYNQQGGVMDEIIEDIEGSTELSAVIDNLHQRKYFDEMRTAHKAFDSVFKARVKEQQQEQTTVSITELRKLTTLALRELLDWVFIRAKTKEIDVFETYIGNLNALTMQYNQSVERRLNGNTSTNQELNDDFDQDQGE